MCVSVCVCVCQCVCVLLNTCSISSRGGGVDRSLHMSSVAIRNCLTFSWSLCMGVCVCERERERERETCVSVTDWERVMSSGVVATTMR